jgi:hypothetical protein
MIAAETKRIMQRGGEAAGHFRQGICDATHADTNQPPSAVAATLQGVAHSVQPRQGCQSTPFEK